jgi:hypothetical protein
MEHPELYTFELNGVPFAAETTGFWIDEVLQGVDLPLSLLKSGENTLLLRTDYNCGQRGLEAVYISGFFGVENGSVITSLPETLVCGDWCEQRLPNYAGNLTYIAEIDLSSSAMLNIGEWRGAMLGVKVNDLLEKVLPWPPYQLELPAGRCRIEITVYGHRRNAFGPFYLDEPSPAWVGPLQFKTCQQNCKQLIPCGLLG